MTNEDSSFASALRTDLTTASDVEAASPIFAANDDCSEDAPREPFDESVANGSVIDRFAVIARRFAGRLAVRDTDISLTYAELARLVDNIATATAAHTKAHSGPVAILLPANVMFPAAMLGILAAGRPYVALDVEAPVERNRLIVAEAGACAVVSSGKAADEARALFPSDITIIDIEASPGSTQPTPRAPIGSEDLAAICYTSGSSGRPKGIVWTHGNLLHWVRDFTQAARISSADRTLLLASPSVFASYRAVYCALLNGASVHILSPRRVGLTALITEIRARGITIYHSVAVLLRRVAETLDADPPFSSVRLACLAGDRAQWSDVDACKRCFSNNVLVYVSLSSTEAGYYVSDFVDEALRTTTAHPPVGRPALGCNVAIVGDDGRPAADEETGNVVIASRFIASGHWQGSELRVLPFPSDPSDPGVRVFASGDRARRRADGLIEFIGRNDQQIKLRGHRIEPAEVESALTALREVREAALLVRRDDNGIPLSLVAYVVAQPGVRGLLPRHLQAMLARRLPRYMVPAQIYLLGELPLHSNYKVDQRALARLDAEYRADPGNRPAEGLAAEIIGIFETMIEVKGATLDDTVASLGGDSLQEVNLVAELERRYGVAMSHDFIEQHATIRQVADWITARTTQRNDPHRAI